MKHLKLLGIVLILGLGFLPNLGAAQVCRTGKPCGNTCIAQNRTCRVGQGTARAGGGTTTPTPPAAPPARGVTAPAAAAATGPGGTVIPEGAVYAASTAGATFYYVGCSGWRSLSPANLRWFRTAQEATAVGYRPSTQSGCGANPAAEAAVAAGGATGASAAASQPPSSVAADAPCAVSRVVDGDTLDCADGRTVRLLLVDAPEMTQGAFGALAKQALEQLAPAGTTLTVQLDVQLQDQYQRLLAYLTLADGRMVNEELLRNGVAVVSVYPPNVRHVDRFRATVEAAQRARAGLWALNAFECLPSDHRAGRCPL